MYFGPLSKRALNFRQKIAVSIKTLSEFSKLSTNVLKLKTLRKKQILRPRGEKTGKKTLISSLYLYIHIKRETHTKFIK